MNGKAGPQRRRQGDQLEQWDRKYTEPAQLFEERQRPPAARNDEDCQNPQSDQEGNRRSEHIESARTAEQPSRAQHHERKTSLHCWAQALIKLLQQNHR